MTRRCLTVITPCYNEEANVELCARALREIMERELPDYDYEHIFADNASRDQTFALIAAMAAKDSHIKGIRNSRNIGPFRNIFHALRYASGDAVVVMLAADLQDPPDVIPQFVRLWEQGNLIVYGVRSQREEPWWLRTCRRIYYRLVKKMSDIYLPVDAGEFQLIDRTVLQSLQQVDDYYPYVRGLVARTGMKSAQVSYAWKRRQHGVSSNNLLALVDQALNGIISTSKTPIRICIGMGVALAILSLLYAFMSLLYSLLFPGAAPMGMPTVIVAQFFFNGVILFFFGILGEYVSAIHDQVRRGPPMIPLDLINFDDSVVQQKKVQRVFVADSSERA